MADPSLGVHYLGSEQAPCNLPLTTKWRGKWPAAGCLVALTPSISAS